MGPRHFTVVPGSSGLRHRSTRRPGTRTRGGGWSPHRYGRPPRDPRGRSCPGDPELRPGLWSSQRRRSTSTAWHLPNSWADHGWRLRRGTATRGCRRRPLVRGRLVGRRERSQPSRGAHGAGFDRSGRSRRGRAWGPTNTRVAGRDHGSVTVGGARPPGRPGQSRATTQDAGGRRHLHQDGRNGWGGGTDGATTGGTIGADVPIFGGTSSHISTFVNVTGFIARSGRYIVQPANGSRSPRGSGRG